MNFNFANDLYISRTPYSRACYLICVTYYTCTYVISKWLNPCKLLLDMKRITFTIYIYVLCVTYERYGEQLHIITS